MFFFVLSTLDMIAANFSQRDTIQIDSVENIVGFNVGINHQDGYGSIIQERSSALVAPAGTNFIDQRTIQTDTVLLEPVMGIVVEAGDMIIHRQTIDVELSSNPQCYIKALRVLSCLGLSAFAGFLIYLVDRQM